ncbi:heparan-alpha-glucosaminide N-acetyltransferase domain-containing protein [Novosphingobium sp. PS1R-30]|uniref:Heparan-alpha-glucosaminide N-acetyltransferase domain-containing protein n=1 Tax=Novosphingobium anseongense TaxID=3133436 RepID=A0ABU8S0G6_9SPHN
MASVAQAGSTDQARDRARAVRLPSLDLLRGLTVAGMIVVNATAALNYVAGPVFPVLLHARWAGFTAADAVFPAFITMVGVSIAISARPDAPLSARRIAWRALRLILLGLVLVNLYLPFSPDPWPPRLPGVLQRIAIVYAISALVYPRTSWRWRSVAAATILALYALLCLLPVPGGVPTDLWEPGQNLASWLDRQVFGDWMGEKGPLGYDPEGLLSTLPALAQAFIGTIAGDLLRSKLSVSRRSQGLAAAGVVGIAAAMLLDPVIPIAKPIWTTSFVFLSAGITLIGLALFHRVFDGRDHGMRKGGLLGSFGRNAITAYALHYVIINFVMSAPLRAPMKWLAPIVGNETAALAPVAIFLAILWLPLAIMDRRGWYVKI